MDPILMPNDELDIRNNILYEALESAASSDPVRVKRGTKQLTEWETEQGNYPFLQAVFGDKSLPYEVRYLAIIQLKNGIDRYWRKTAAHAVTKDDKTIIRSRLLASGVDEENERLALQNALVIGKIVRYDYPNDWPTVIDELHHCLGSSASLRLSRILLISLHVIKDLVTGRLPKTKALVQSVTPGLVRTLGQIYLDRVHEWQVANDAARILHMEQSLLALESLKRLLILGYDFPSREEDVRALWQITKEQIGTFFTLVSSGAATDQLQITYINKHMIKLSKLHMNMARIHPADFVYLPQALQLVRSYWSLIVEFSRTYSGSYLSYEALSATARIRASDDQTQEDTSIMDKLCLHGLKLIRVCVKMVYSPAQTFKYRTAADKEEKAQAIHTVSTELFTDDFVREMSNLIVSHYFVLRPSDLRQWEDEPEEWEKLEDDQGEDYEFSVRACAEKLFLDLAIFYTRLLAKPLVDLLSRVRQPSFENIISKDSVYTAIGLAAPALHEEIDFDDLLTSTLTRDVQDQRAGCQVLRRRVAILIGHWVSVRISKACRPTVYEIFRHLLNKDDPLNDQVVRVTAGRQFYKVADEWEFDAQQFFPYAPDTLTRLMLLIEEVELTDTKLALLNTISVIVERLQYYITPYADRIITLLPPLWDQSGNEHLMKQAILTILSRLINAMKTESQPVHAMVLPIISGAIELGSATQIYLLDDALDLWSNILTQTPAPASSDLLSLVPNLLHLLDLATESLRKALEIAESYVLLAPADMLSDSIRNDMLAKFTALLGSRAASRGADGIVTKLVEMMIRAAERLAGEQGLRVVTKSLTDTGFLSKMLNSVKGNWESNQTTGPNKISPAVDVIVETDYFALLARIALASPQVFVDVLQAYGATSVAEHSLEHTLDWVLQECFANFGDINDPSKKKLMCLALTNLLEMGQPWMLRKLQDLFSIWVDTVQELDAAADPDKDCLVYWETDELRRPLEPTTSGPESPEDTRRRELTYSDPVHRVYIIQFIRQHLHGVVARCGGQQVFADQWLVNVDKDVIDLVRRCGIF